jgi:hypothetical protein
MALKGEVGLQRSMAQEEGELGFLFIFKTLMRNLNKVNLHNSRSPNLPNAS